jgi:hypothetical protein
MPTQMMNIIWSDHAIKTFDDRGQSSAPVDRIERQGRLVQIGEEFHIKTTLNIFVCKRLNDDEIIIVTVMFNTPFKCPPKQRRQDKNRERLFGKSLEPQFRKLLSSADGISSALDRKRPEDPFRPEEAFD